MSSDNSDDNDNESNTITDKEEMSEFGSDSSGTTSSNPESSDSADNDEPNNNDVGRRERGSSHRGRARGRGRQGRSKAVGQGNGSRSAQGRKTSGRASLTIPSAITVTDTTFVRGVNVTVDAKIGHLSQKFIMRYWPNMQFHFINTISVLFNIYVHEYLRKLFSKS